MRPQLSISRPARRAQRGVILFIALIVLVAMSLAGIALMRSVDTNVLIAGNLAFRQSTVNLGDVGIEGARAWLNANSGTAALNTSQPGGYTAYFANWQDGADDYAGLTATTADDFNWNQAQNVATADPAYTVSFVINRMCKFDGDPTAATTGCMSATTGGGGGAATNGSKGTSSYGTQTLPGTSTVLYRVTVRVIGPRNTVSYVQAVVN